MAQPMVAVKKVDGSFEHITLDELKKRQATKAAPVLSAPAVTAPKPTAVGGIALSAPKALPRNDRPPVIPSVLSGQVLSGAKDLDSSATPQNDNMEKTIVGGVASPPRAGRNDKQDKILDQIKTHRAKEILSRQETITPHRDDFIMDDMLPEKQGEIEPTVYKSQPVPATTTPFNSFVKPTEISLRQPADRNDKSPVIPNLIRDPDSDFRQNDNAPRTVLYPVKKVSSPASPKPMVRDIVSSQVAMGPVEEIKGFSLTDFRRMASDPQEAAARLKQKFINLKEESIVFYFEALSAWKLSPLHLEYIGSIAEMINSKQTIAGLTNNKNKIQPNEIAAITAMEKNLI